MAHDKLWQDFKAIVHVCMCVCTVKIILFLWHKQQSLTSPPFQCVWFQQKHICYCVQSWYSIIWILVHRGWGWDWHWLRAPCAWKNYSNADGHADSNTGTEALRLEIYCMSAWAPSLWLREVRKMLTTTPAAWSNWELRTVRYSFHNVPTEPDTKTDGFEEESIKTPSINNPNTHKSFT